MMQRIVECMKNNDLSQLMCAPFNNPTMQQLATDMSTALKNIRTHLNEEETKHQYYENLLNQVDTAVIVCYPDGRTEWMNKPAQRLLGNCNRLPRHHPRSPHQQASRRPTVPLACAGRTIGICHPHPTERKNLLAGQPEEYPHGTGTYRNGGMAKAHPSIDTRNHEFHHSYYFPGRHTKRT